MPITALPEQITIPDFFPTPSLDHGWNVILHNDDITPFQIVVEALMIVLGYDKPRSEAIMWEAHTLGKASVIVTSKVLAEQYKERLEAYRLTITIEEI
jgi:ATP-dependent Clp protease adapter protein ClpS